MTSIAMDFLDLYWPWLVVLITAGTVFYGGIRFIFCKGKDEANGKNRIKLIEDDLVEINKRIDRLQTAFDDKEIQANETHREIEKAISELKGITETLQKLVNP